MTLSVLSPSLSSAAHKSEPFSVWMNNLGGEQQNVTQVGVNSTLSFGQAPFLRSLPFYAFELEYTPIAIVHWITPCVFVLNYFWDFAQDCLGEIFEIMFLHNIALNFVFANFSQDEKWLSHFSKRPPIAGLVPHEKRSMATAMALFMALLCSLYFNYIRFILAVFLTQCSCICCLWDVSIC